MKSQSRERRRDAILDAAAAVLSERGYRDTSMLEVARRASASKETLYAWFGDKQGLFRALVERNAATVGTVLSQHLDGAVPVERLLLDFGRALLELLTGEGAVAINRAAISEATSDPSLARTLASAGRAAVLPVFVQLLERHARDGALIVDDPGKAAEDFLGLLLGDLQVRLLLGVAAPPAPGEIEVRASHATTAFMRLYAA